MLFEWGVIEKQKYLRDENTYTSKHFTQLKMEGEVGLRRPNELLKIQHLGVHRVLRTSYKCSLKIVLNSVHTVHQMFIIVSREFYRVILRTFER